MLCSGFTGQALCKLIERVSTFIHGVEPIELSLPPCVRVQASPTLPAAQASGLVLDPCLEWY